MLLFINNFTFVFICLQWKNFLETNCIEIWPAEYTFDPKSGCIIDYPMKKAYYLLVTVTLFFVPVIIMALSYSLIVWKLWGHQSPGELMLRQQQTQNRSKKKVSQTRVSTYYQNIIPTLMKTLKFSYQISCTVVPRSCQLRFCQILEFVK